MRLAATQTAFRAALLDAAAPIPDGVTSHVGDRPERRYAVYRGNVMASLVAALRSRFPATLRIVGDACFDEMARRYVREKPPRSPVLLLYGEDFPDFVEGLAAELGLPYLGDVLRLEVAWGQAYHAADAAPATVEALARLDPEALAGTTVVFHPAARLLRSAHPVVTLWAMNAGGGEPGPIADWRGEDALVTRPHLEVSVHRLPPGGFAFLDVLRAGRTLGAAVEAAFEVSEAFDPVPAFAGLVAAGVATRFDP